MIMVLNFRNNVFIQNPYNGTDGTDGTKHWRVSSTLLFQVASVASVLTGY